MMQSIRNRLAISMQQMPEKRIEQSGTRIHWLGKPRRVSPVLGLLFANDPN